MADMHSFDVAVATEYGIPEAILLQNIKFWVRKNKANGRHLHDGCYWTYNSSKAFSELFPYLSARQISRILARLKEADLIKVGNYNKSPLDRTLWYTLTDKAWALYGETGTSTGQNGILHLPDLENGFDETENGFSNFDQAIPDINTYINTDVEPYESERARVGDLDDDEIPFDDLPTGLADIPCCFDVCGDVAAVPDCNGVQFAGPVEVAADVAVKKKKKKAQKADKVSYAEFVTLTEQEYEKLLSDERLGSKEAVDWCIEKLNDYKGSCNKKYSSDYFAIRRWVIDDYCKGRNVGKLTVTQAAEEVRRQLRGIRQNE